MRPRPTRRLLHAVPYSLLRLLSGSSVRTAVSADLRLSGPPALSAPPNRPNPSKSIAHYNSFFPKVKPHSNFFASLFTFRLHAAIISGVSGKEGENGHFGREKRASGGDCFIEVRRLRLGGGFPPDCIVRARPDRRTPRRLRIPHIKTPIPIPGGSVLLWVTARL